MRSRRLRARKWHLGLIPVSVAALLGICCVGLRLQDLERSVDHRGAALARQLAAAAGTVDPASLVRLAQAVADQITVRSVLIVADDGRILAQAGALESAPAAQGVTAQPAPDSNGLLFQARLAQPPQSGERAGREPTPNALPVASAATGWVWLELSAVALRQEQRRIWIAGLTLVFTGLMLSALVVWSLARDMVPTPADAGGEQRAGASDEEARAALPAPLLSLQAGFEAMGEALRTCRRELEECAERAAAELVNLSDSGDTAAEEALRARQRALSVGRARSEFLAALTGRIEILRSGLAATAELLSEPQNFPRHTHYLAILRPCASSLLVMVNDLLRYAKIEAGRLGLESVPFELRRSLDEVLASLAQAAYEKGLELIALIYADVPGELIGDPIRLRQILTVLLANAIRHTPSGSVTVRIMLENAETPDPHILLRVTVSDTGIGIAGERHDDLFVPAHGDERRGLVVARSLTEQMGGKLGIDPDVTEGTTFWLSFPCAVLRRHDSQPPGAAPRGVVLLHDPHPLSRLSWRHLLSQWGLEVREAATSSQWLALAREAAAQPGTPALALVGLPADQPATAAFQRLLETLREVCDCPIVALAPTTRAETLKEIQALGAVACLPKVGRSAALYDTLSPLLQGPLRSAPPAAARESTPAGQTLRVLVAEDNRISRQLVEALLSSQGAEVSAVENGQQALDRLMDEPFDLLLMDLHMPVMDGFQATALIRSLDRRGDLPIIALTASTGDDERERALAAGLDDFLPKPVTQRQLQILLHRWRSGRHEDGSGSRRAVSAAHTTAQAQGARPPVLDRGLALSLAGGDSQLAQDLFDMLVADLTKKRGALAQAAATGDRTRLKDLVHKLHGATSYCGVPALHGAAASLDKALTQDDQTSIAAGLKQLEEEIERLLRAASS